MGYSFKIELHALDSDVASDFVYDIENVIVAQMKKHEKVKENCFNTDGILNVAMVIQDYFKGKEWQYCPIMKYAEELIPRFEKWIEKQDKNDWDSEKDKQTQMRAYRKVLSNLKKIIERNV